MPTTLVPILALAAFLWTGALPAQQPAPIPSGTPAAAPSDTLAVQRLKAWLDAFNSGDRARLLRFMETQAPGRVSRVDADLAFRNLTGSQPEAEPVPSRAGGYMKRDAGAGPASNAATWRPTRTRCRTAVRQPEAAIRRSAISYGSPTRS